MASTKPTEAEYTDAMRRHGTAEWTADDQRVMDRWLDQHQPEDAPEPAERAAGASTAKGKAKD